MPVVSIKPTLPFFVTAARPSWKPNVLSYWKEVITLPVLSMKPILPFFTTHAKPSEKSPALSYSAGITTLPVQSIKPAPVGKPLESSYRYSRERPSWKTHVAYSVPSYSSTVGTETWTIFSSAANAGTVRPKHSARASVRDNSFFLMCCYSSQCVSASDKMKENAEEKM